MRVNQVFVRTALVVPAAAMLLMLGGCVSVQNCVPEKSPDGYNTGRMKCPIGQRGGPRAATQVSSEGVEPSLLQRLLMAAWSSAAVSSVTAITTSTFDANAVRLSVQGSSVLPAADNGMFTLSLFRGNTLLASKSFAWIRNSTDLLVAEPGSMNAWVQQHPDADGYEFGGDLVFRETSAPTATIASTHVYNSVATSSTMQTFSSPRRSGPGYTMEQ